MLIKLINDDNKKHQKGGLFIEVILKFFKMRSTITLDVKYVYSLFQNCIFWKF